MTCKKSSAVLQLETANFGSGVIRVAGSNRAQCEVNYFLTDHLGSVRVIVDGNGVVKERNDYYSFGARHVRGDYPKRDNRYKYNGKEDQVTGDLGWLDYGWRMYDAEVGWWFSNDPQEQFVSLYVFNANNPLLFIDLDGQFSNPVYDNWGYLLGTDDFGLQGDPLFMSKKDFKQGMSHEDALKKNQGLIFLSNQNAFDKFIDSYNNLYQRPDWDGKLTLEEANEWYRNGNGQPLFVDLSKIDLSGIYSLGEKYAGEVKCFNLLLSNSSLNDGLVYGSITLKRYTNHTVRAYSDLYDFDMKSWRNPLNWGRNVETIIGAKFAGNGIPYKINIYGSTKLKPLFSWIK